MSNKGGLTSSSGSSSASHATPPLLPQHKFGPHDVVAIRPNKGPSDGPPLTQGVVYRVKDTQIIVAVDDAPDEGLDVPLRLEKLANEVTYKRLKDTLTALSSSAAGSSNHPGGPLVDVMFGKRGPRFVEPAPEWSPVNTFLDESQRRAISLALSAKDVALIHGPPGTGKTTAVVEYIRQEVARGSRVLACAASNIAVDNLVERLMAAPPSSSSSCAAKSVKVVRLGHPARLLPQVIECSLEAQVLKNDNSSLAKDCRKEIKSLNQQLMKLEGWKKAERWQIRNQLKQLGKEEKKRQTTAVQEVIKHSQVVASTLTGVLHYTLENQVFDVAVIDEAAQALEVACWGALLKAKRAVLAGDHLQLPPTIISEAAANKGLGKTLFERLQGMYKEDISEMLTVQYRMNEGIMTWSSKELYEGKVCAHESVAHHDLPGYIADIKAREAAAGGGGGGAKTSSSTSSNKKTAAAAGGGGGGKKGVGKAAAVATLTPRPDPATEGSFSAQMLPVLLLIDTAGCGFEEQQEEEGDSRANPGEAKAVMAHVVALMAAGVNPSSIGIITPYNAQVALLKDLRPERLGGLGLEISSVDGFQGREKEAIIISMVRSNADREVGFLSDKRRMNVAVTRARRQCAIICDTETVSHDPFLGRLVKYFEEHGEYMSAGEYVRD